MYSSTVTFELWKNSTDQTFYVRVWYWPLGSPEEEVTNQIVGCTVNCPLDTFINRSQTFMPGDNGDATSWCDYVGDLSATTPSPNSNDGSKLEPTLVIFIAILYFKWVIMKNF
uniref:Uncharacterized protein n=1 Tax=Acrobeloides nanus TaxID=290746 RepID=A0A914CVU5_9BILA